MIAKRGREMALKEIQLAQTAIDVAARHVTGCTTLFDVAIEEARERLWKAREALGETGR